MVHNPQIGPADIVPLDSLKPFEPLAKILTAKGAPFEWEEKFINGRLTKVWKNLPVNCRSIWLDCIKNFGVRDHLVYEDSRYTYDESHQEVLKCANWLRGEYQVRKGDHVAIIARNVPEFVWSYYAICLLGAIPCIINAFSDTDILVFSLLEADVRVVIMDHERWSKLKPVLNQFASPSPTKLSSTSHESASSDPRLSGEPDYKGVEGVVVFPRKKRGKVDVKNRDWSYGKSGQGFNDWEELGSKWSLPEGNEIPEPKGGIQPEDISLIIFTSGTTGRPKAVISTNRQQLSTSLTAGFMGLTALLRRGGSIPEPEKPGLSDNQGSGICLVPLFHLTGLGTIISAVQRGTKLVLMYKYSAEEAAELIIREKVKTVVGIGFMVREIINSNKEVWNHIETMSHGGSSSAKEIPDEIQKKGRGIMTSNGYGMTEVNIMASANLMDEYNAFPSSVGRTAPVIDFKIVDLESGTAVGVGELGEVWIKSPGNAIGYYKRPQATQETFTSDGYVRSGDLGKIDENGLLYILDRAKDIIIRGGENITCSEVEQGVYNDNRVMHCGAVPLSHPTYGEEVAVVCVIHEQFRGEGKRPTAEEIKIAAARTLPKHMVPSYVWIRDEDLPRNPSGKVLKKVLKEEVKARATKSKAKL